MSTVIIATGETSCMKALGETCPVPMLPLVDRPVIQHVVEYLVGQGRSDLDVILSHLPQQVEDLLGDGSRWGCRFRYHLVRDLSQVGRVLKTVLEDKEEPCLLVNANRIPKADIRQHHHDVTSHGPVFYCSEEGQEEPDDPTASWTGWAWLPPNAVRVFPVLSSWDELYPWAMVRFRKRCRTYRVPAVLRMDTYADILSSHVKVLDKAFDGLLLTGREVEEGIWISRNVELHPGARLTPPVYIGRNCHIGRGIQLGPHAVVGRNCVLDERSSISRAVIFPDTYVGEALELNDVIVDRNRLISEKFGSEVTITDEFILSSIREKQVRKWLSGVLSRVFAAVLLLLALPILPYVLFQAFSGKNGRGVRGRQVVMLPAEYDPTLWKTYTLLSIHRRPEKDPSRKTDGRGSRDRSSGDGILSHFLFSFLPGLINVVRGDLQVIGVEPRTKEEIMGLDAEWRTVYLKSKAGLITESLINFGSDPQPGELYSAEMVYSTSFTRGRDLKLLAGYFRELTKGLLNRK